ncbi:MAG: sn-glycerol-3-phosphate ABC transporter ATP-binding protein UgpC [Calditrichae bacterium]|nr:sn-glycerol-3-phosphate ABC transporter ATP-binding protein UgpC [Calditrichota bacterium]MCB9058581.1 sn-glycerol-3-phosphate ABC transporter ATP-binding protein UgpC [Calditrichia bacterium]
MAEVVLKNISKVYDNNVSAVNNVSIEIPDKEFVVLVGPSGCGKSTILRMIAGLEEITSGELFIGNKRVNDVAPKDRDIAMVFQNYALYPHMTVFENIAFGLKLRKMPKDEIKKRVTEAAKILDIEQYLDRRPKALSGGQRQRVAIGRSIVRHPQVFLFDEPLSNLDAKLRTQMRIEIKKLHKQLQTTMIYVTHDQMEAMTLGSQIVVLKDGNIQQIDTPDRVYNQPANKFVAGFIGSPAMNFIDGMFINENGWIFKANDLIVKLPAFFIEKWKISENKNIMLGIRPEHLLDFKNTAVKQNLSEPFTIIPEVIEPVGNEILIYTNIGNRNICMRANPNCTFKTAEEAQVALQLDKIHCFEKE